MTPITLPRISIVISVKDRSEYLREALISLQSQTIIEWECIIVDDHSTEDLNQVVEGLNDERFKLVKNTGKPGISASRNLGNSLAQSEWIAVADSDDIYLPRRLELTLDAIKDHPEAEVIHANMYQVKDGTYQIRRIKSARPYDRKSLYEENMISHITVAYKKSLVLEERYSEDVETAEDYDLWLAFADRYVVFHYIEEPVALWRRHSGQESTNPEKLAQMVENAKIVQDRHPYHA